MTSTPKGTGGERFESVVLVLILLTVGGFTASASFSHVHDWTMANSPDGTHDWFGWANAVTTELVPTASALVIRRRHRNGQPARFAMFLLFMFVGLSLTAQLSVARPTIAGYIVSAIPAVAFMLLTKLILSAPKSTADPVAVPTAVPSVPATTTVNTPIVAPTLTPAPVAAATAVPAVPTPAMVASRITPASAPTPIGSATVPATTPRPARPRPSKTATRPAPVLNPPTTDSSVNASGPVQPSLPIVSPAKLARARELAAEYEAEHGTPITAGQLAVRLKVRSDEAAQALAVLNLNTDQSPRKALNGMPVKATR